MCPHRGLRFYAEEPYQILSPRKFGLIFRPGLPPWEPHVGFRRVQTLVREGSPLVSSCASSPEGQAHRAGLPPIGGYDAVAIATLIQNNSGPP